MEPGYTHEPDWSVRDLLAHLGTWLAESQLQFERIRIGSYDGHDIASDALDADLIDAMADQPWTVTWVQANAARTRMLLEWYGLAEPDVEAAWWIRKAASDHLAAHMDRLGEWVAELIARRGTEAPST